MAARNVKGGGHVYPNERSRRLKYKSAAKSKRKEARRKSMGGVLTPKDTGEELPPFFLPPRYKLLFKIMADNKNCTRIGRKPIPDHIKKEFAQHAKEYQEYKQAELLILEKQEIAATKVQYKSLDSLIYLPDYLLDECT